MPLQAGVVLADGLGESECHDGVPVSSLGWDRGGPSGVDRKLEIYDPRTDRWSVGADMPTAY
ncbi:Kelch repeat-containing protein, partial [Streptomyces sp. NPDC055722]